MKFIADDGDKSVVLLVMAKSAKAFCLVIHAFMRCKMSKSSFCEPLQAALWRKLR